MKKVHLRINLVSARYDKGYCGKHNLWEKKHEFTDDPLKVTCLTCIKSYEAWHPGRIELLRRQREA